MANRKPKVETGPIHLPKRKKAKPPRRKTVSELASERLARLNATNRARVEPLAGGRVLDQDDRFYRRDVIPTPGAKPLRKPLENVLTTKESPRSLAGAPPESYQSDADTILLRANDRDRKAWREGPYTTRTYRGRNGK